MKIVHASSVHPAGDNRIALKECRSLVEHGHDVVLVAARGADPGVPGLEVLILPEWGSRAARFTRTVPKIARVVEGLQPDMIHIHDPELLLVAKRLSRCAPVVFDMHENVPAQILTKTWIPRFLRRPAAWSAAHLIRILSRHIAGVVFARSDIEDAGLATHSVVVENYPRLEEFPSLHIERRVDGRALQLAYIGIVTRSRGAGEMVRAMSLLPSDLDPVLHIAGPIRGEGLREELEQAEGWNRIEHHEWLGREAVAELLESADIGLVILSPDPNHTYARPTKLFEYMAAGCAVVGSDLPTITKIIREARCGAVVPAGEAAALAATVESIARDPRRLAEYGRAGRRAVEERYNWDRESEKLMALYERIAGTARA